MNNEAGTLFICATPIGNLEDITLRAIKTLKEVDLIAAEDTRHTQKLLNHFQINTKTTSYHEHNKYKKGQELLEKLKEGKNIALVSDAGMPAISDPGYELINLCINDGVAVTVVPGAVALISALVLSGFPTRRFVFEGFLPQNKKERTQVLENLKNESRTIIIYEAPHHLLKTLEILKNTLGEDRASATVKELTKKYEQVIRGTLKKLIDYYSENEPKGEFIIIIEGTTIHENKWEGLSIEEHVNIHISEGMTEKEAMKKTAAERGISKREVYSNLKC